MKKLFICLALVLPAGPALAQWHYSSTKDKLTDEVTKIAWLQSPTTAHQGFPYNRVPTELRIYVVDGQLSVKTNQGQLMSSRGIVFRFDDDDPETFESVGANDGSSQTLYVSDDDESLRLIERLPKAKRVRVQVVFFQHGSEVFEFRPTGLKISRSTVSPATEPPVAESERARQDEERREARRQAEREAEAQRLSLQRLETVQRDAAAARLASMLSMVPSLTPYSTGAIWVTSVEPPLEGSHPSNGVLGVACKDGRKVVVVVGTEFKTKRALGFVPATLVRYYFDEDDTLRNWEQLSPSESTPFASQNDFVLHMTTANVLKVAFQREGLDARQAVTFRLDQDPLRRDLVAMATSCK